jgi:hypothetical protein
MASATDVKATKRPSTAARRTGYVFALLVNGAFLYAVNVWPGWDVLPFLTDDFTQILGLVNASIVVSLVANLVYLARDTKAVKALGDIVTTGVAIAVGVRTWQVFPFDFGEATFDWELVVRILLVVGIVGMAIAIIVNIVSLVTDTPSRS